jgi:hypothetical protein
VFPSFELAIIVDPRETPMASEEPKAIFDYRIVYENGKKAILKKIEEKRNRSWIRENAGYLNKEYFNV